MTKKWKREEGGVHGKKHPFHSRKLPNGHFFKMNQMVSTQVLDSS